MPFPKINYKAFFATVKQTFSEQDGQTSFGRVSAAAIIASTIFWVTYIVMVTHGLPDLAGPTLFMTTGSTATYGANKASEMIKAIKGTNDDPYSPPQK